MKTIVSLYPALECVPFKNKLLIMPSLNGKYCLKPLENIVKLNLKLNNFWCVKCKPKVCCQYTNFPLSSISRNWHFMSQFLWHYRKLGNVQKFKVYPFSSNFFFHPWSGKQFIKEWILTILSITATDQTDKLEAP